MPHTALYRKKRPKRFGEMIGQKHITQTLLHQLQTEQVNHAYLFCGTRGTGKTSAAKIFARAINCLNEVGGEPCNKCRNCESILAERSLDVAEIDAASNNGVENIRDLRDEVKYLPSEMKYKVYIIDEVHMLSTNAFNALLKTLEEPPPHVIFILATTDPQKIPVTILSRCQRYDFRRIAAMDIVNTLKKYMDEENIKYEDGAMEYIAYHSDGAMRDALSLLDQCISIGDLLSLKNVKEILQAVDREKLFDFTDALTNCNGKKVMEIIDSAMKEGRDISQFAADLVRHFRDVLVVQISGGDDFSAETTEKLKTQGKNISSERLILYINTFSETIREMKFAPHLRTAFEVTALKLCVPQEVREVIVKEVVVKEVVERVSSKNTLDQEPEIETSVINDEIVNDDTTKESEVFEQSSNDSDVIDKVVSNWGKLCKILPMPLRSWCANAKVEKDNGLIKIICDNETSVSLIKGKQSVIREKIADNFNLSTPPNLAFEAREGYNVSGKISVKSPSERNTTQKMESAPAVQDEWSSFGQALVEEAGDDSPF